MQWAAVKNAAASPRRQLPTTHYQLPTTSYELRATSYEFHASPSRCIRSAVW